MKFQFNKESVSKAKIKPSGKNNPPIIAQTINDNLYFGLQNAWQNINESNINEFNPKPLIAANIGIRINPNLFFSRFLSKRNNRHNTKLRVINILRFKNDCIVKAKTDNPIKPGSGSLFLNIQMHKKEQRIKYKI